MPQRVNGSVFSDQVLTGSLRHYLLVGADFSESFDDESPVYGSAAEEVARVITQKATIAIFNPYEIGISFALESNRANWDTDELQAAIRALGTDVGTDHLDLSAIRIEEVEYKFLGSGYTFVVPDPVLNYLSANNTYFALADTTLYLPDHETVDIGTIIRLFKREDVTLTIEGYDSQLVKDLTTKQTTSSYTYNFNEELRFVFDGTQWLAVRVDNDSHRHTIAYIDGLQDALDSKQDLSEKGQPSGYASLNSSGTVPEDQLPSYVDDVLEYTTRNDFPAVGETGKIYTDLSTNRIYRWSGSTYIEVSSRPPSTDEVPEGSTNLYFTDQRASDAAPIQSVAGKTGDVTLVKDDITDYNESDYVLQTEKGQPNGVATLDSNALIPSSQLPDDVYDVYEYSTFGSFPTTGESGIIYIDASTDELFRWTGTEYVNVGGTIETTDDLPEGNVNLYFTEQRSRDSIFGGTGVTYAPSTGEIKIGQDVAAGAEVSFTRINGLLDPIKGNQAASKQYVDGVATGVAVRPAVNLILNETEITGATYYNGPNNDGVNATLTSDTNGQFPSPIQGTDIAFATARLVLNNQSNPAHNGLWVLDVAGDASTPWQLRRCKYCDTAEKIPGAFVFVKNGDYESSGWVAVVEDPATFTVGTDSITWTQFSGPGLYLASDGIILESETRTFKLDPTVAGDYLLFNAGVINADASTASDPSTLVARDVNGDFSANTITSDLIGNVTGQVSDISNHTTDDLSEGTTNLYYTDERVDDRVNDLLQSSSDIILTYDDTANTLTISANATDVNTASALVRRSAESTFAISAIDIDTTATVPREVGRLRWNQDESGPEISLNNEVNLQVGQEVIQRIFNDTGATLSNGQVVRIDGSQLNEITVSPAQASSMFDAKTVLGVVTETIADQETGFVTNFGKVRNLNTDSFSPGDDIYLSATTPGGFTNVAPSTPNKAVYIGTVIRSHPSLGSIFVRPDASQSVSELSDVELTNIQNDDILVWDTNRFVNSPGNFASDTHALTHLPSGSDPIATATATTVSNNTNTEGTAESFARSDHTHQISSNTPSTGQILVWNGSDWESQNPDSATNSFYDYSETEAEQSTNSSSYVIGHTRTVTIPATGNYEIQWHLETYNTNKDRENQFRVQLDNTTTYAEVYSSRENDRAANDYKPVTGFKVDSLIAGTHTFDIDYRAADDTAFVRRIRLIIKRLS